jgi:hypothetical protein
MSLRYAKVKLRLLLIILIMLGGVGYGSGPQANDKPRIQLEHPKNPHLDIPKNCRNTVQADNSILLTCECEACGVAEPQDFAQAEANARAEQDPDQWVCQAKDGGLYCDYNLDTETSPERRHSHI